MIRANGIRVYNDGQLYLHTEAGKSHLAHEHVDDTQLLLMFEGADSFIDGDFHSFGYGDSGISMLHSAFTHSLAGISCHDHMKPREVYRDDDKIILGAISKASSSGVTSSKAIRNVAEISQSIHVSDQDVEVCDKWTLLDYDRSRDVVARFLLSDTYAISIRDQETVQIDRLERHLTMSFSDSVGISIIPGEKTHPYYGWYSTKRNVHNAGYCMEIRSSELKRPAELNYSIIIDRLSDK